MRKILKTYFQVVPLHITGYLCLAGLQSILPTCSVWVNARFVDWGLRILKEQEAGKMVLFYAIWIVIFMVAGELIPNMKSLICDSMSAKMQYFLEKEWNGRIASLKYEYIENSEILDLINRVGKEPEKIFMRVLGNVTGIVLFLFSCIGPLSILFVNAWLAGLISLLMMIPFAWLAVKSGQETYEVKKEITKKRRAYEYLSSILVNRESAKERTLFGYADKINQRYFKEFEETRQEEYKPRLKWYFRARSGGFLTVVINMVVILFMLEPVLEGNMEIGMFTSLITYFADFRSRITWELPKLLYNYTGNRKALKDFSTIVALKTDQRYLAQAKKGMVFESLVFENVSFTYPGTEKAVLKNISFRMEKGKHYAFVGENGTGKTTITRLIMGMYDQYTGRILVNGRELREMHPEELKGIFAQQYQDFAKYAISLEENIQLGNMESKKIDEVIQQTKLVKVLDKLPKGKKTLLGKLDKEGVDLSGGEWQRVAMARTAISSAPFKILDEPTAALDPVQENYVYQQFMQMHKDTTTLLISHRLGSVIDSDVIFVLDHGKIEELGSHMELMKKEGLYQLMYEKQKAWYE